MRILVDTDVLLDVALQRAEHVADSDAVVKWCEAHSGQCFVAWHTVSNIYYIMRDDVRARQFLAGLLDTFEVPPTGTSAAKLALRLPMGDFEDAMQIVAAIEAGADVIVTRNESHYRGAPISAQSPTAFLASVPAW